MMLAPLLSTLVLFTPSITVPAEHVCSATMITPYGAFDTYCSIVPDTPEWRFLAPDVPLGNALMFCIAACDDNGCSACGEPVLDARLP